MRRLERRPRASSNAICSYDPDWGSCNQLRYVWFYNQTRGTCDQFLYGGCEGNPNRFETFELCQKTCELSGLDPCMEPLDRGTWCEAMSNRYYFNKRTRQCKGFHYTGCGKSGNNFLSKEESVGRILPLNSVAVVRPFRPEFYDCRLIPILTTTTMSNSTAGIRSKGPVKRFCPDTSPGSSPRSTPMSLTDALREVNDSSVVPSCIKNAFNSILDELTTVKQERDRLFRENLILRKKIGISLDAPVTDEDDGHNVVDDHNRSKPEPTTLAHLPDMEREGERLRSVVISGRA
ncbi:unnamed protein product [Heligmosomoides polygyrus]|uniref:BPTI/Kunitz inhibitor domain-containing protein n=1 Tax=Heligmosomoides polygyrus TaxID=6339 RepID=A0A183F459_HELPZ|nr:unnamed protein product [Heligmosomoides polygyrus]